MKGGCYSFELKQLGHACCEDVLTHGAGREAAVARASTAFIAWSCAIETRKAKRFLAVGMILTRGGHRSGHGRQGDRFDEGGLMDGGGAGRAGARPSRR